ncbi:MAG: M16 family metallopeptidase [Tepidimonas sp.]|uniref:M16 family metallopeptidase n=1 Tax=Tepidimonas sp. TaxID=2002775 RepID=UPI004054D078
MKTHWHPLTDRCGVLAERGSPWRRFVALLLAALTAAAVPSPVALAQTSAAPAAGAPRTQVFQLDNGLTVIVQTDRRSPTAVQMLWVRVGAVDETDRESGVAHLLEHMMFKGTPTVPEGEFSRRIAALGGSDNAFTSRDATAYYVQLPAERLPEAMRLEADRFAHNTWSDEAFRRERAVVQEERRQRIEDEPQAQLYEQFTAMAWTEHPYRRPVIGWMGRLQTLDAQTVRDFYQRWYVAANAALVIVGDVDVAQVRQWAQATFGQLPARAVPPRLPDAEPPQRGPRRLEWRGRTQQPVVLMGWRVPRLSHPDADDAEARDALALVLLAGVLDGHSAARLERALVQGQGGARLADTVGASYGLAGRGPELFLLNASPKAGVAVEAVEAALKAEIGRIARDGVTEAELQRVKNQWMASEVYKLDSTFAQARELGMNWVLGWPPDAGARLLERLQAIGAEDVRRVAQRYFVDDQLTVGILRPQEGS